MKRFVLLPAVMIALLSAGCGSSSGDEPVVGTTKDSSATERTSTSPQGPFEDSSSNEPNEEPSDMSTQTANFNQSYSYDDGMEIEVTKIKHGKVTRSDAEYSDPVKSGADYVSVTFRVKNGSNDRVDDLYQIISLTYGPDGEEAETPYIESHDDDSDLSGTLRPGKSKSGSETFAIPSKYQDDVQLEITFGDYEPAVFAGSIK